jgi:hypothetical protein
VTLTENRTVQIGIAGSVAVHVALFFILAWMWGLDAAARWMSEQAKEAEKQVTLLYPEQVIEMLKPILPPPPPKPESTPYIRTTQNQTASAAPAKANFISDRNTTAASEKPASADGEKGMPTTDGIDIKMQELANRDVKDGEIKDDSVPTGAPSPPSSPAPPPNLSPLKPQMRVPDPVSTPQPKEIAKATPADTPLAKMMEEMDKDMARLEANRLPLEVRKPEPPPKAIPVDAAPPSPPQAPTPPDAPPPAPTVAKALPLGPTPQKPLPKPDKNAFSPFTRTSKVKGTINNRGEAAVDAAETPMGRYMRAVTSAVEKKWHIYRRKYADAVTFGNVKLRFYVTKVGDAEDFDILSDAKEADPRMTDFTLRAIRDAEIPPIPPDLLPMLDNERFEVEYDVIIY